VHQAWLKEDARSGLEELRRLEETFNSLDSAQGQLIAINSGLCYLGFGKVKAAEAWFQKIESEAAANNLLAMAAYARGDEQGCRDYGRKLLLGNDNARKVGYASGVVLARLGLVQSPQEFIEHYKKVVENIFVIHLQGELALSQGKIEEAIHLLQVATDDFRHGGNHEFLISSESLALASERRGDLERALRILEEASRLRVLEGGWDTAFGVFGCVSRPIWRSSIDRWDARKKRAESRASSAAF
jgi:tetratricopeptide (TPR) repeat protein